MPGLALKALVRNAIEGLGVSLCLHRIAARPRPTDWQAGLSIPRLTVDVDPDGAYRYNLIVVRGGNPKGDFEGHVALQASLSAPEGGLVTLTLPDDQPETRAGLDLRFKYYQRIEGTLRLPAGTRLTALTARAYEDGSTSPRATRTLTSP